MAEAVATLPAVVSGPTQQNFDALNKRLAAVEALLLTVAETVESGLKIIRGGVEITGTEAKIIQGSGFTLARLGTGESKITFSTAFRLVPTVLPTARAFNVKANCSEPLAGSAVVGLNASGVATNGIYDFIAIGPK